MIIITKLIYLDFQTAFDMIPYQKDFSKLSCLKIKDKFLLRFSKNKCDRKRKDGKM